MTYTPRLDPMPTAAPPRRRVWRLADWPELAAELDRWGEAGRIAPLWWRDDDAVAATPELAAMLRIARRSAGCAGRDPGARDSGFGCFLGWRAVVRGAAAWLAPREPRDRGQEKRVPERSSRCCRGGGDHCGARPPRQRCSGGARCRFLCRRGTASRRSCSPFSPQAGSRPSRRLPRQKRPSAWPGCRPGLA